MEDQIKRVQVGWFTLDTSNRTIEILRDTINPRCWRRTTFAMGMVPTLLSMGIKVETEINNYQDILYCEVKLDWNSMSEEDQNSIRAELNNGKVINISDRVKYLAGTAAMLGRQENEEAMGKKVPEIFSVEARGLMIWLKLSEQPMFRIGISIHLRKQECSVIYTRLNDTYVTGEYQEARKIHDEQMKQEKEQGERQGEQQR